MSLDVSKYHVLKKYDEQIELVLKYHILVQVRTLMYFVNYIYFVVVDFVNISKHRYCGKVKHTSFILEKQQYYLIIWKC